MQKRTEIRRHCLKSHTKQNGKVAAAAISSERGQLGGGNSTKVEAAKRRRQDEERGKAVEVHLATWFSVVYREEVHEKVQRKVWYFLWN